MLIDNKYNIGDLVYLKTDIEQHNRMIVSIQISKNDIIYKLSLGVIDSWHYDFEMTLEKNILQTIEN